MCTNNIVRSASLAKIVKKVNVLFVGLQASLMAKTGQTNQPLANALYWPKA